MLTLRIGSLALISVIVSLSVSSGSRIDPAGIAGTFILSSEEKNQDAIEEFVKIAGNEAKILILNLDATAKANDNASVSDNANANVNADANANSVAYIL